MDAWPLEQWLPMVRKQSSSPSVRMTLPSCTYTHTPHSPSPHPRQQLRIFLASPPVPDVCAAAPSASAVEVVVPAPIAAVAPTTAAIWANDRRVMESLPIRPPSLEVCSAQRAYRAAKV